MCLPNNCPVCACTVSATATVSRNLRIEISSFLILILLHRQRKNEAQLVRWERQTDKKRGPDRDNLAIATMVSQILSIVAKLANENCMYKRAHLR